MSRRQSDAVSTLRLPSVDTLMRSDAGAALKLKQGRPPAPIGPKSYNRTRPSAWIDSCPYFLGRSLRACAPTPPTMERRAVRSEFAQTPVARRFMLPW